MTTQAIGTSETSGALEDDDLMIWFRSGQDDVIEKSFDSMKDEFATEVPSAYTGVPEQSSSSTGYAGSSTRFSRGDHRHRTAFNLSNDIPEEGSGSGASGTGISASRWDHVHPVSDSDTPSASDDTPENVGSSGVAGTSDDYSRADHVHQKASLSASISIDAVINENVLIGTVGRFVSTTTSINIVSGEVWFVKSDTSTVDRFTNYKVVLTDDLLNLSSASVGTTVDDSNGVIIKDGLYQSANVFNNIYFGRTSTNTLLVATSEGSLVPLVIHKLGVSVS